MALRAPAMSQRGRDPTSREIVRAALSPPVAAQGLALPTSSR